METRKSKHGKRLKKRNRKMAFVSSCFAVYLGTAIIYQELPGTFAWLMDSSVAKGQIHNATSEEMLQMAIGEVKYEPNSKIKSQISIKNKSLVSIPLNIEVLINKKLVKTYTTVLDVGKSYTTELMESEILGKGKTLTNVQYRIVGFEGYIDQIVTVPLNQEKLKPTLETEKIPAVNEKAPDAGNATPSTPSTEKDATTDTEEKPADTENTDGTTSSETKQDDPVTDQEGENGSTETGGDESTPTEPTNGEVSQPVTTTP
ncbi:MULTISPECIES: hypothetical protein [unclassified Bacillus (in: firmicutes)]|uniref:hypothetical protein n=1 Tax=unclassified Bacillus (in: firmicutes) TaxID=185979 RepID=UPI0008F1CAA1|nr:MULTISPECIES: hypothetical protein [unclassified Bacillus (in: firmicutes)]SFA92304.1 hypothetical protein SAMN02799634_102653 [Bacillus sp. UNCCL13]SFQ85874.1 hypothetical protein SAMN04488577_2771 [Bacillus sp. cl95]